MFAVHTKHTNFKPSKNTEPVWSVNVQLYTRIYSTNASETKKPPAMKYCKKLPSERLAAETARNPKTPDPAKAYINTTPSLLKWKSIICTPLPTRKDELTIWVPTSPASIRNGVLPFVKTSRWSEGFHQIRSLVAPLTWGRGDVGTWGGDMSWASHIFCQAKQIEFFREGQQAELLLCDFSRVSSLVSRDCRVLHRVHFNTSFFCSRK